MVVTGMSGRKIRIEVRGEYDDDIQISDAEYLDGIGDVAEDEIEFIERTYAAEIYEEWHDGQVSAAEYYRDSLEDR